MSSPKNAEREAKIKFWQPHITAWQRSGLTAAGYCKKSTKNEGAFKFIEVTSTLSAATTNVHSIEVKTPAGYCLNIPSNFDEATLLKLLAVLRGAAC